MKCWRESYKTFPSYPSIRTPILLFFHSTLSSSTNHVYQNQYEYDYYPITAYFRQIQRLSFCVSRFEPLSEVACRQLHHDEDSSRVPEFFTRSDLNNARIPCQLFHHLNFATNRLKFLRAPSLYALQCESCNDRRFFR